MNVRFTKKVAEGIGWQNLRKWGLTADDFWSSGHTKNVNLATLSAAELKEFEKLIADHKSVRGIGSISRDLIVWKELQAGETGDVKARTVNQFSEIVTRYLAKAPGHRVFRQSSDGMLCHYVNEVVFHKEQRRKDDAIASRCIARLHYDYPAAEELRKIWNVLSTNAGAKISNKTISDVVKKYPRMSGRDVKNILKLCMLIKKDEEIDLETVDYVEQFLPTRKADNKKKES